MVLWNKLVETFKLFPRISPVVYAVIDIWWGGHCQHKMIDKHYVEFVPLELGYDLANNQEGPWSFLHSFSFIFYYYIFVLCFMSGF